MLNPIRFSGLSLNKDELTVENGELAVCAGLELKDGFVRPSLIAGTIMGSLAVDDSPATLLYVHHTGSYTHYLAYYTVSGTVKLVYFNLIVDGSSESLSSAVVIDSLSFDVSKLKDIDAVGNTLVLVDEDGLVHYLLWRDSTYEELPQKPPMIDMLFRLGDNQVAEYPLDDVLSYEDGTWGGFRKLGIDPSECFDLTEEGTKEDYYYDVAIKEDHKTFIQNTVYALMNECNAVVTKAGHFYAPFMIRYCYRMFDGSFFMHSAPVFLPTIIPSMAPVTLLSIVYDTSGDKPQAHIATAIGIKEGKDRTLSTISVEGTPFYYAPLNCALEYQILNNDYITSGDLAKWKDIIKSVDIFITAPQTPLTTDREISSFNAYHSYSFSQMVGGKRTSYVNGRSYSDSDTDTGSCRPNIPMLSYEEYFRQVRNNGAFFRLKSIDFDEIAERASATSNTWTELDVDSDVVRNIEVQKQLTDDYKSHNLLKAVGSYVYNHRVNLWGLKERLFQGFSPFTLATWTEVTDESSLAYYLREARVKIHTDRGDYIVSCPVQDQGDESKVSNVHFEYLPLFYPDARATELFIIYDTGEGTTKYVDSVKMEECVGLNGAMTAKSLLLSESTPLTDSVCPVSSDPWVDMPSKIYTAAMDNPFYFPLSGINTVGTGTIIGLASTTRALSQGQFGQYPLMAFTTDGIWALEVSSTGSYSSIHPISREVATSPEGICMLDQAVVFVSSRGANILQESQVTPLSDALVGVAPGMLDPDVPASLFPEMVAGIDKYFSGSAATQLTSLVSLTEAPVKFLQHAVAVNDSTNHRVFFIDSNNTGVALVLALDSLTWSYMAVPTGLVYCPGYPYAYISYPAGSVSEGSPSGNTLVRLDTQYDYLSTSRYIGMLLTRTLSFGGLYTCISGFRQSHSIVASSDESLRPHLYLYGSNDLRSWHFIGHTVADRSTYMPAQSFRYFRIGLLLSMRPSEQYMQTTLDITDKYQRL